MLLAKNLTPVQVFLVNEPVAHQGKFSERKGTILLGYRRISEREIMLNLMQLARLLAAGVPIDRALTILIASTRNSALTRQLEDVSLNVQAGKPLAKSLASAGISLPAYAFSLIEAGELSGDLEGSLLTVSAALERNAHVKAIVKNSLTYPTIMIAASLVALILLFTFMLPRFSFVENLSGASSTQLRFLLGISSTLRWLVSPLLGLVVVAAITYRWWFGKFKSWLQTTLLNQTFLGEAMRLAASARLLRCLGSLLKGGVNLPQALDAVRNVTGYPAYAEALQITTEQVASGGAIATVWRRFRIIPRVVVELAEVGEETGDLATAFIHGADLLEEDLRQWVTRFTAVIEPVLILVIAGVVGFVVISILLPVINMTDMPI